LPCRFKRASLYHDRASVAIRIGGSLSPDLLPGFCAAVENDGAFTDWEGTAFDPNVLDTSVLLYLDDHEVAWGRFVLCRSCPDLRPWAGGAPGAFGPERVVFDGATVRSFSASDDDEILISAETVRGLGSYAAVLSHLAAAELEIPPFRICGSL
jgi:hypothetical protein